MAGLSEIEWTDATWNPVAGCTMISPGCTNCYAMRMAARLQAMKHDAYVGTTRKSGGRAVWTGQVNLIEKALEAPLRWKRPRMVFVNSMSDLFQERVPEEYITRVWEIMSRANWHTFQVLTKRPDLMRDRIERLNLPPLGHVWLGTSVESQEYLHRIEELRMIEGHIRFISFEPLIGSVGECDLREIHWAIVGGESGPGSRPLDVSWVEDIHSMCRKSGTAFFFKQWGGPNKKKTGRSYLGQTWDELPDTGRFQAV